MMLLLSGICILFIIAIIYIFIVVLSIETAYKITKDEEEFPHN